MKTALSQTWSPWSKSERRSAWRRRGWHSGIWACSSAVAAPYGVPAASAGDIVPAPVDLMVTGWPPGSEAKLSGAGISAADRRVHARRVVDLGDEARR